MLTIGQEIPPRNAIARLTAGLKCAPETGPRIKISTVSIAPVGRVLHSKASAPFPPDRRCAMMPEPITVASKNAVPIASEMARRATDAIKSALWLQRQSRGQFVEAFAAGLVCPGYELEAQ